MLSTENPPPDLCEISQLKSGSDENTNKQQLEVDLFKSGLDYNNPLSKFSIRDYVFNTRGKDIENNWPFSQKNLQLCLRHGVKDVLPPFHSLGSAGNPSIEEAVVDSLRYSDVRYTALSDGSVRKRPAVTVENNLSEFEEDREFPLTTTSQSCSDLNSVLPIRNSCSEPEARCMLVSCSEKPKFAVREFKKGESNIQSPVKKCRLSGKLNNTTVEPKSNEDSAVNTPVVSETMASKVCPVCKTFSSSSNTTLNAHIDQCLSGESTIKWTSNAKVIKHRIKPRKTRLMVDIYETALSCTLEDLDKRNGTNWASNMGLHPQDLEASSEEKKTYSPFDFEDTDDQAGAVYIDSSGTKLRILSKLDHPPAKLSASDSGVCQFVKRDKGLKLLSSNKKKRKHAVQKGEFQKNYLDGQGSCSPVPDSPPHGPRCLYPRVEVNDDRQKLLPPQGHKEVDPTKTPSPTASDHKKLDDFGMIKKWVSSKRTGLKRKINRELGNQLSDKSLKNLRIKSVSSLGDRGKSDSAPLSPISSDENPSSPPHGLKRKENLCRSLDGWTELPRVRKGPGFSLLRSENVHGKKNPPMSSKSMVRRLRKESALDHEHPLDSPNREESHASSRGNKKMGIRNDSTFICSSISRQGSFSSEGKKATRPRKLSPAHAMPSGGRNFSSLRTKLLSVKHASGSKPKKSSGRDLSSFKNPMLRCMSRSDEEAVVSKSTLYAEDDQEIELGENAALMEKDCGALMTNRTRDSKIRKRIGRFGNKDEEDTTSKGSETTHESDDSRDVGERTFIGSSIRVDASSALEEEAEMLDDFVCEPASTDGEAFVAFSKSLDSAFTGLAGSNVECVSQYYSKSYDEHCTTKLAFHADQEMFCADNVGKDLVTPDSHEMAELDGGDEAHGNYFVDVDPIPIPGPPGSFLPSPGRMGSEELLGISSLTTCRIQSSDDGHEVVDMDSSDSPVSAMSTVSNSVAGRSSSISTTNLSVQSHFQHETRREITEERNNPVAEHIDGTGERELNLLKSKPNLSLPEATREVQNIQPCCCSRKDVSLQGSSVNYQEPQILRRRATPSLSVLAQEKQETLLHNEAATAIRKDVVNSTMAYASAAIPRNPEAMFQACGDCEFPSPSTSNPVLRLMGKNLMVVNKDDDLPTPGVMIEHSGLGTRFCDGNGRNHRHEPNLFHHVPSRAPPVFDSIPAHIPAHQIGFNSTDAFKIPTTNYMPSTPVFPSMRFGDVSAASASGCREYGGGFDTVTDHHLGSRSGPYDHNVKVGTPLHRLKKSDSYAGKHKEIIIIDDSPETEAATPTPLPPEVRRVNMFYSYQTQVDPRFAGPSVVANRNTMVPPSSKGINNASLPPSAHHHLRSSYFSPGFS